MCNINIDRFGTYHLQNATPTVQCFLSDTKLSLVNSFNSHVFVVFSEYVKAISVGDAKELTKLSQFVLPTVITILHKQFNTLNNVPSIPPRKKNQPIEPVLNENTTYTKKDVEMMLHCIQSISIAVKELYKDFYKDTLRLLLLLSQHYFIALGAQIIFTLEKLLVALQHVSIYFFIID